MTLWVIVPVKELQLAKSRLAVTLSAADRVTLMQSLLLRLLRLLEQVNTVAQVLVVSRDAAVRQLAEQAGHLAISEGDMVGLNGAVRVGVHTAAQNHATHTLILPVDLPLLELEDVIAMTSAEAVAICPDRAQQGTNALLVPTAVPFVFQYGRNSFQLHQEEAGRHQLPLTILNLPRVQFDLDTQADWIAYQRYQMRAVA